MNYGESYLYEDPLIQGYRFKGLMDDKIIYRDTDKVDDSVYNYDILITHNSDYSTSMANVDIERNKNMIWFSTNVDIKHERIRAIPIGLENPEWHPNLVKIRKILALRPLPLEPKYLCSAIFNTATHPSRRETLKYFQSQPWCHTRKSINGADFNDYVVKMKDSKFVVCPRGNGIDTHRLWETLYMGKVPIVERCVNTQQLIHGVFPAILVDSFEEVTEELLIQWWNDNKYSKMMCYRLLMSFWEETIWGTAGYYRK